MSEKSSVSLARAIAYSVALTADDPRFNQDVEVRHEDGSLWYLRAAFWMIDPNDDQWMWIITEHFGEQVFAAEEVTIRVVPMDKPRDYVCAQDKIEKFRDLSDSELDEIDGDWLRDAYRNLRDHHIKETGALYARLEPVPRKPRS